MIINPFANNPAFSSATLTDAINRLPYNMYGRLGELGIFTDKPISTKTALIEEQGGVLNLIPTTPRGAPAVVNERYTRKMRAFYIPHVALEDFILPDDVQDVRTFGSDNQLATLATVMNDTMVTMKNKHAITLEWLRIGALRGILYDANGSSVIYNFFNEFGMSPFVQNFQFSSATFDVSGALLTVKGNIEDNLHGDVMDGVRCFCSPEWFAALTSHPNVKVAFQYFTTNQQLSGDYRKQFEFAGIIFEQYRGTATDASGTAHRFIPANTAQFFPTGTQSTFRNYWAPADFNETVNTLGLPFYAKQEPVKFDRGTEVHTQMNPLPICLRPEVLAQGTLS